ncbi:MAG: hypothetical protein COW84_00060 [Gammaproteobacteria bacterium CG22_combo_CG10-13_8_21_14_all_40_8]|nr:MAG: hypothetical protein COW84_00060 [Gammaproteobacteria bacterium CG22_combo_CG10-13_8_21_14_all_40_8]
MLEKFREGVKGPWAKVVGALIMASFVFAGVSNYFTSPNANNVALVNGEEISVVDFNRRYQQEKNRFGEQFEKFFSNEQALNQFKQSVVEHLITSKLLTQASKDLGLYVSDAIIYEQIRQTPQFQKDGKYDADTFRNLLSRVGYSQKEYEQSLRSEKEFNQLKTLSDSEFVLKSEIDQYLKLSDETRTGAYLQLSALPLQAEVDLSGDEGAEKINHYYETHLGQYLIPEKVSVEYIDLSTESLKSQIHPADAEVKTYFEQHLADYSTPEQRKASHILINLASDAKEDETTKAMQKLKAIQRQIMEGADFAEVAKKQSDDTVSAENGGDLGFFGKKVMDPEFEKATFALQKVGDVSEIVRSQFGLHLIKLTEIHQAKEATLDDVKDKVVDALKKSQLELLFSDKKSQMTEKAFEYSDSLKEVAQELGLTVQVSEPFSKTGGMGVFTNPMVIEAAFSDQVLGNNFNSDVINIDKSHALVLRLKKHTDSYTQSLEQVKTSVEQAVITETAKKRLVDLATKVVAGLKQNKAEQEVLALLPSTVKAEWVSFEQVKRTDAKIPSDIRTRLFLMEKPASEQPNYTGQETNQGFAIIKLEKVTMGDPTQATAEQRKQVEDRLSRLKTNLEEAAFQAWLKENAKIERFPINNG